MRQKEGLFKSKTISEIKERLPGCIVLPGDPSAIQGIPDTIILHDDRWAMLEFKKSNKASKQPNQPYWVDKANTMSFARIIEPSNKEEVLDELYKSLATPR